MSPYTIQIENSDPSYKSGLSFFEVFISTIQHTKGPHHILQITVLNTLYLLSFPIQFLRHANTSDSFASQRVWILPGWFQDNWWQYILPDVSCDVNKLTEELAGHITISWINRVDNATKLNFGGVVCTYTTGQKISPPHL